MFSRYSHLVKRIFDLPIQVSSGPDEEHDIDRDIGTITKEKEPELKKPPLYKVVLINDDYTPMEFVVEILSLLWNECRESDSSYVKGSYRGKGRMWSI